LRVDGDLTLHSHLRMDGFLASLSVGRALARRPDWQIRAILETEAWTAVGYRLPVLELFPTREEGERLGHLGPDPLADEWDPDERYAA
jgi:endonuclease-8